MTSSEVQSPAVCVVGGGLGGVAATIAAATMGTRVVLIEPTPFLGGQITTQLVPALDEHPAVEHSGVTARYADLRRRIRRLANAGENPGGGWVSRLCFLPEHGRDALAAMLAPFVAAGLVEVWTSATVIDAGVVEGRVVEVVCQTEQGERRIRPHAVVDASELGELLPALGVPWVIGSEGQDAYGESLAVPGGADPDAEQSCTWAAALTLDPSRSPAAEMPAHYVALRDNQPFTFDVPGWDRPVHRYRFDTTGPDGHPPFWTYRRLSTGRGPDVACLNWPGNDYRGVGLVADPTRAHREARELTLAFTYWLQHEAPREDGGQGHPVHLDPKSALSDDGLALAPYVRESRRLASSTPITQHDLTAHPGSDRGRLWHDSVGVSWYSLDIHARVGHHFESVYTPTPPTQIPARCLVTEHCRNLVAGCKNLAATQVAASSYRVHPGEWAVGEAAGVIAATAARHAVDAHHVASNPALLLAVQSELVAQGAPLIHAEDLPFDRPGFAPAQLLLARGVTASQRVAGLGVGADEAVSPLEMDTLRRAAQAWGWASAQESLRSGAPFAEVCRALAEPRGSTP